MYVGINFYYAQIQNLRQIKTFHKFKLQIGSGVLIRIINVGTPEAIFWMIQLLCFDYAKWDKAISQ